MSPQPSFFFSAKLWQRFTREPSASTDDERNVHAGFNVPREAGKLGAILLQFPFSFHESTETTAHLSALLNRFPDYPLVVDLRHSSWQDQATLELLRERNAAFCNIDQPIIGNSLTHPGKAHRASVTCGSTAAATTAGLATIQISQSTNAATISILSWNSVPNSRAFARSS